MSQEAADGSVEPVSGGATPSVTPCKWTPDAAAQRRHREDRIQLLLLGMRSGRDFSAVGEKKIRFVCFDKPASQAAGKWGADFRGSKELSVLVEQAAGETARGQVCEHNLICGQSPGGDARVTVDVNCTR